MLFSVLLVHTASCKYVICVERFVNTVRDMYIYVAKSIVICLYANKLFVFVFVFMVSTSNISTQLVSTNIISTK